MQPERPTEMPVQKFPGWWHDVIRTNYPGNQINPDRFETHESSINDFSYLILSLSKKDPKSNFEPGIYILTTIPVTVDVETSKEKLSPISSKIEELLDITAEVNNYETFVPHPVSELAEAGIDVNLCTSTSYDVFSISGDIVFSLRMPTTAEIIKRTSKEDIEATKFRVINEFFERYDYLERANMLFNEKLKIGLRREIFKRESMAIDNTLQCMIMDKMVTQGEVLGSILDPEVQKQYSDIMERISKMKNPLEKSAIIKTISDLPLKLYGGWIKFYDKYWTEKLGIKQSHGK